MTLAELALQEFKDRNINFQPMYPAVVVRVLPKEHMSGSLWLPDTAQNKPVYEGIVIRSYPPKRTKLDSGKYITLESGLEPGDHILFPHWSGEAIPWLPDKDSPNSFEEYRAIPARGPLSLAGMKDSGEPFLIINKELESVEKKLFKMLVRIVPPSDILAVKDTTLYFKQVSEDINTIIEDIKKEFDIFVKVKASVTISGE